MSIFDIIILAFALSVDATIVSFSNGLIFKKKAFNKSIQLAFFVGFFQFLMPIIGYYFANSISEFVKPYSHWLIFIIFSLLGFNFIKEAFSKDNNLEKEHFFNLKYLLLVSVATSIDALFAGVSISFAGNNIFIPSIIIGCITFINSMLGFFSADMIGNLSSKFLEISGGLILILLAFKVLFVAVL